MSPVALRLELGREVTMFVEDAIPFATDCVRQPEIGFWSDEVEGTREWDDGLPKAIASATQQVSCNPSQGFLSYLCNMSTSLRTAHARQRATCVNDKDTVYHSKILVYAMTTNNTAVLTAEQTISPIEATAMIASPIREQILASA